MLYLSSTYIFVHVEEEFKTIKKKVLNLVISKYVIFVGPTFPVLSLLVNYFWNFLWHAECQVLDQTLTDGDQSLAF